MKISRAKRNVINVLILKLRTEEKPGQEHPVKNVRELIAERREAAQTLESILGGGGC